MRTVTFLLTLFPMLLCAADPFRDPVPATLTQSYTTLVTEHLAPHPRLWWSAEEQARTERRMDRDPVLSAFHAALLREARKLLQDPPPERVMADGRRLLAVSRQVARRLGLCAYAWRTSGDDVFLQRVKADLRGVLAFTDWNPGHFLDVAEMAVGVAWAYDWCHDGLLPEERQAVVEGLKAKALLPGLVEPELWWVRNTNNWNQVCHGGLGLAALAIADQEPALAARILARAEASLPCSMTSYAPDGAYPEGPGYWNFGTTYAALLLDALQSGLGRRPDLIDAPGFLASGMYQNQVVGPSGRWFNYADVGAGGMLLCSPTIAWLATAADRPEWWRMGLERMQQFAKNPGPLPGEGTLPFLVVWTGRLPADRGVSLPTSWRGNGPSPVAFHRTAWSDQATWIGFKGGSPSTSHGHMDVGSFVMDAQGVRWAEDLGFQRYHTLENQGINPFQHTEREDAPRWRVFRFNAQSHNVLTVDGQNQRVAGHAPIIVHRPGRTVIDLTATYAGQVAAARRGVALAGEAAVVQDELLGSAAAVRVRWAMVTRAAVTATGSQAQLSLQGRTFTVQVLEPAGAVVEARPLDPPPAAWDAPNPGITLVGFHTEVPPGAKVRLRVALIPQGVALDQDLPPGDLATW